MGPGPEVLPGSLVGVVPMDVPVLPHQHGHRHARPLVAGPSVSVHRLFLLFLRQPCRFLDLHVPAETGEG